MSGPLPAYYNYARPEVVERVNAEGARILDVGCAAGAMGAALLARGAKEVAGVEREARAVAIARARLTAAYRVDLNSLPELPYPDGYFDAITFADVLEHLVEPADVLRHLRRYLKDGGTIVCSIPNVRHESVLLPLLVHGSFKYADAGILDRTHLRFYTLSEIGVLMQSAGFAMEARVDTVSSPPSPHLGAAAALVASLGGDAARFRQEACVIQYLVRAKPNRSLVQLGLQSRVPAAALGDRWSGSKPFRVLFAPDFAGGAEHWLDVVRDLTRDAGRAKDMTVGVAIDAAHLEQPPEPLRRFADEGRVDLVLIEAPREPFAWERLLAGASAFVDTAGRDDLVAAARRIGLDVRVCARSAALTPESSAAPAPAPASAPAAAASTATAAATTTTTTNAPGPAAAAAPAPAAATG